MQFVPSGMNLTLKEGAWTSEAENRVPEYFNGSKMASQTLYHSYHCKSGKMA